MSMILLRSPLEPIGMNHAGAQKRRSARLSQEAIDDHEPPAKRSKVIDAGSNLLKDAQNEKSDVSGRKRAKKVYESEIGDFTFSRGGRKTRTKDARPTPTLATPSTSVEPTPPKPAPQSPTVRASRKTPRRLPTTPERDGARQTSRGLSVELLPGPSPIRPAHAQSHANSKPSASPRQDRPLTVERTRKHGPNGLEEEQKVMKINLPFHDTPVNRKNKKMRKSGTGGHRRSSTGMRGRRASSLIDEGRGNGVTDHSAWSPRAFIESHSLEELCNNPMEIPASPVVVSTTQSRAIVSDVVRKESANSKSRAAVPHTEVLAEEFYKHISADLLEPRRMRLLLGWCGDRALPERPDYEVQSADVDVQAQQKAYTIQSELCKDLMSKASLSDWYSRDESATIPLAPLRKKPNPRNVVNAAKAEELERELERLKQEQAEWDQLLKSVPVSSPRATTPERRPTEPLSPLNTDLLDSPERDIWEQFQSFTTSHEPLEIQKRLNVISTNLEFAVDQFAHGIHTLTTTKQTAERIADKTLTQAATLLDARAKARETTVDGTGALKALGKVLNSSRVTRR